MGSERVFRLYLYSTTLLIVVLLGFVLLGTGILLVLQQFWLIPDWIQYMALTVVIAVGFVFSGYLAARPAKLQITNRGVRIKQRKGEARTILWGDIRKYAYYDELTLQSFKVLLRSEKTLSIIDFKWKNKTGFQSFMFEFEAGLKASPDNVATTTIERSKTFYGSRKKVVITITLFIAYVCLAAVLWAGDTFVSWNPVMMYYFWVMPVAFFIKMLKAK
ncbi:MAG: hypothetical protein JXA25_17675 [Anaerolineales bacterium]|nr:hypothetical protein [Anaerolineales bacterium]